jgi:hypothetical protein
LNSTLGSASTSPTSPSSVSSGSLPSSAILAHKPYTIEQTTLSYIFRAHLACSTTRGASQVNEKIPRDPIAPQVNASHSRRRESELKERPKAGMRTRSQAVATRGQHLRMAVSKRQGATIESLHTRPACALHITDTTLASSAKIKTRISR